MEYFTISASSLNSLTQCERLYKYSHIDRLQKIPRETFFAKGIVSHEMLATFYRTKLHHKQMDFNERIQLATRVGHDQATELELSDEDRELVLSNTIGSIVHHANESWVPVAVETEFNKILYTSKKLDVQIIFNGKVDLLIDIPGLGRVIVDHKTSSRRSGPSYLSNQFMGYCWALNMNRIIVNQITLTKTGAPSGKYNRPMLDYEQVAMKEWGRNAIHHTLRAIHNVRNNRYPMRFNNCSFCSYKSICEMPSSLREGVIESEYERREI